MMIEGSRIEESPMNQRRSGDERQRCHLSRSMKPAKDPGHQISHVDAHVRLTLLGNREIDIPINPEGMV
jgi:hypothetical protein